MKKIAIHSVPRSGSSWIGQIFNSSPAVNFKFQPLFSYAFKDYLSPSSSKEEIETFFKMIAKSDDSFLLQQEKVDMGIYPHFRKDEKPTYVVYKEVRYHHILKNMLRVDPDVKVIGIVRNPYAVINSFLNAPREFRKDLGWDELNEWQFAEKKNLDKPEEFNGYEKWKEVTLLFHKLAEEFPDRFYLLHYDELLTDPLSEVKRFFLFCGLEVGQQTEAFLASSTQTDHGDAYAVYKKKETDDGWKKTLNPIIAQVITEDLIQNDLEKYIR